MKLTDLCESRTPKKSTQYETTKAFKINWTLHEHIRDEEVPPQFIFAKNQRDAMLKLAERLKNTDLNINYIDSVEQVDEENVGKRKKKKNWSANKKAGWNKAEQHTEYDPPKTKNKGVSARQGFVG